MYMLYLLNINNILHLLYTQYIRHILDILYDGRAGPEPGPGPYITICTHTIHISYACVHVNTHMYICSDLCTYILM